MTNGHPFSGIRLPQWKATIVTMFTKRLRMRPQIRYSMALGLDYRLTSMQDVMTLDIRKGISRSEQRAR